MKTLFGIEAMNALPELLFSDEAAMWLAGFNAVQIREGVCRRRQEKRQGDKAPGPMCPDTLANNRVVRGPAAASGAVLARIGGGTGINTAYIERLNATFFIWPLPKGQATSGRNGHLR